MIAFFGAEDTATNSWALRAQYTLPGDVIAFGLYSSLRPHDSLGGQSCAGTSEFPEGDYDRTQHDRFT